MGLHCATDICDAISQINSTSRSLSNSNVISVTLDDERITSKIYNDHVERFLYSHKLSESMLRTQWPHYLTAL